MIQTPFFSVIVPTHDRPERLQRCLAALTRLNFPSNDFEVVVVDDGSRRPMDDVVEPYRTSFRLSLIRQENTGPAGARNRGAEAATGRFLAFTDDDCEPAPDWLAHFQDMLLDDPDTLVGGKTVNNLPTNIFSNTSQLLISFLYEYHNSDPGDSRFLASNNIALSRKLFLEAGGFDTQFQYAAGEDREFCDRWHHNGRVICYSQLPLVYHKHYLSLRMFARQHFTYGRSALYFHRLRRLRRRELQWPFEPIRLFYFKLLVCPYRQRSVNRRLCTSLLLLLSQALNAVGYFYELACSPYRKRHGHG